MAAVTPSPPEEQAPLRVALLTKFSVRSAEEGTRSSECEGQDVPGGFQSLQQPGGLSALSHWCLSFRGGVQKQCLSGSEPEKTLCFYSN